MKHKGDLFRKIIQRTLLGPPVESLSQELPAVGPTAMPPERRAPRRIDTAVQIIYNNKWRYPAVPSNATYSFISESQTRESSRIPRPSPLPPASPLPEEWRRRRQGDGWCRNIFSGNAIHGNAMAIAGCIVSNGAFTRHGLATS